MTDHLRFQFDIEPVAKGRPRVTKSGHAFTPAKTREAEAAIKKMAQEQMKCDPLDGPLKVKICIAFTRPKSNKTSWHTQRPDVDNVSKLVLDSCNGIVWGDDSQIVQLECEKHWGPDFATIIMWVDSLNQ